MQETLTQHEEAGTTDDPEYEAAVAVFYARHVCRAVPMPDCVMRSFAPDHGQSGRLPRNERAERVPRHRVAQDVDVADRLQEITTPTLLVSGRHDEATPLIVGEIHRRIPGAQWVIFEESSHMPHVEEPEAFLDAVERFLRTID